MKKSRYQLIITGLMLLLAVLGCNLGKYIESTSDNANQSNSSQTTNRQSTNSEVKKPVERTTSEKTSDEPIRSTDLIKAFEQDMNAANAKYKGKTILVSGKITNINDVAGVKALFLRDSESETGLQTYLANKDDAKKVKVGDEIIVRGKVRGDKFEILDDAVVVEVK